MCITFRNVYSLCITFRNFPKVPFLLNSNAIPLLGFLTLLTRIKSWDVQVSDYFFVVSKSSLGTKSLFLHAALGMLPIKSTSARTIRKKSCLNYLLIKSENMVKIILKFCFLFEVSSPEIPPNENFKNSFFPPFLPSFSIPLDFENFQIPSNFVQFKNLVPPYKKGVGLGGFHYPSATLSKLPTYFIYFSFFVASFGVKWVIWYAPRNIPSYQNLINTKQHST